ncbi:MAG: hemolysin family protein [Vicinamibacterales bacterium]|nr:hemolysin family protein [Vicinamibacterales bacterium]
MTPLALFVLACLTVALGCVETAFSAMLRLSFRLMAERDDANDRLTGYLADPLSLFVPVRLLSAACLVLAALLIELATGSEGWRAGVVIFLAMGIWTLGLQYALPALIIRRDPEQALTLLLPVFDAATRPLAPLTRPLVGLVASLRETEANESAGVESGAASGAEGADEDAISDEEGRELLRSIVDFTDALVREVMTPRPDVVAIPVTSSLADLRSLFREEQYSRFPVYRDSLDNILGVVFVKDLVALPAGAEPPLTTLMRTAHFVPESKRATELLKELQRTQSHMAIVVDEYGGTAGLVTVEDLLEEIVGEIRDEYDTEGESVIEEEDGAFLVQGKANVDDVAEHLGLSIVREGFETVGGLLLARLGRMPYVGETFETDALEVEVVEVERRRITRVRLRRVAPADGSEAAGV